MTGAKHVVNSPVSTDSQSQLHVPNQKERRRSSGGSKTLSVIAASWENRRDSLERHHGQQSRNKSRSRYT